MFEFVTINLIKKTLSRIYFVTFSNGLFIVFENIVVEHPFISYKFIFAVKNLAKKISV